MVGEIGPPSNAHPTAPWPELLGLFGLSQPRDATGTCAWRLVAQRLRVETIEGSYAIKEMVENPASWWVEQLEVAVAFELTAWRSGQIAMAEPVPVAGSDQLIGHLESGGTSRSYRCHRWVDGQPGLGAPPDPQRSARVGSIVAALARLDVRPGTTAEHLAWNALDAYDETAAEATSNGRDWAVTLSGLRPHVLRLRAELEDHAARRLPMVVLHRDIDPKNTTTRTEGTVALFDWDYAGPRLPACELLDAALSFAGGPVDAEGNCVRRTVDAYRVAGGPAVDLGDAAAALIEESFRWIMLNA